VGKDFCLLDEETIQKRMGGEKEGGRVDSRTVEVDGRGAKIWQLGSFLLLFFFPNPKLLIVEFFLHFIQHFINSTK